MLETATFCIALIALILLIWLLARSFNAPKITDSLLPQLEEKHRAMLLDLNDGLNKLSDRMNVSAREMSERISSASQANSEGLKIQFRKSY